MKDDFYPRSPCGERRRGAAAAKNRGNFYPRSPCGERPCWPLYTGWNRRISIHALLAESDQAGRIPGRPAGISIHALLAESDFACWYIKEMTANISIHALLAESDHAEGA